MREYSFHEPSASAKHTFRRLRQANTIVFVLLGLLVVLGIWNVLTLAELIRADARDLAEIGSIRSHISSQLITWVSAITLIVFVLKEWKWGERTFGGVFLLTGLLFLWLVPVMSAEVEPELETMQLRVMINHCQPGGIEGSMVVDSSLCTLAPPESVEMFMTTSDPLDGDPEWLEPDNISDFGPEWIVEVRGKFRVYFLIEQQSMEQCTDSRMTTSVPSAEQHGHHCLEQDDQVWMVQAYETSAVEAGRLTVYQEVDP